MILRKYPLTVGTRCTMVFFPTRSDDANGRCTSELVQRSFMWIPNRKCAQKSSQPSRTKGLTWKIQLSRYRAVS